MPKMSKPLIRSREKITNIISAKLQSKINTIALIYSQNMTPIFNISKNFIVTYLYIKVNMRVFIIELGFNIKNTNVCIYILIV